MVTSGVVKPGMSDEKETPAARPVRRRPRVVEMQPEDSTESVAEQAEARAKEPTPLEQAIRDSVPPEEPKEPTPLEKAIADSVPPAAEAKPAEPARPEEPQPSFAEMFDAEGGVPTGRTFSIGDAVEGTVVHLGAEGAFVELGGRQQAFYPNAELVDARGEIKTRVGARIRGFVVKIDAQGNPELGRQMGGDGVSLDQLRSAMDENIPVEGKVSGVNRGGVSVMFGKVRGFCPMAHLELHRVQDASKYLQQTLKFHVIEVKEREVVVSRRAILEAEAASQRAIALEEIKPGARLVGTVARVVDFGAFVELAPGIDGLIPTREMSFDRRRPDQIVSTGQRVEVLVTEVTQKGGKPRIALSLKALGDDPWDRIDQVAPRGQIVQGVVRKLMEFGAFIELAPGIEGLLHISELGAGAKDPSSYMSVGEPLLVVVQSVDKDKQRISLAPAPKDARAGAKAPSASVQVGDIVEGNVEKIERFGLFVQLDGLAGKAGRGLIPFRELGVEEGADLRKKFPLGSRIKAKVIEAGRLKLSIKAMKDDEDRAVFETYKKSKEGQSMGTFGDLLKKSLEP